MATSEASCTPAECVALREQVARLTAERDQANAAISELERQFNEVAENSASIKQAREAEKARSDALEKRVAELSGALGDVTSREETARAAAHKAELAARLAAEERDAAQASADLRQREIDRMTGEHHQSDRMDAVDSKSYSSSLTGGRRRLSGGPRGWGALLAQLARGCAPNAIS